MSETEIKSRIELVLLFDVLDGNPNGDPDAGNLPRVDPETGQGLVTDVALKRKIRNYVEFARDNAEGFQVFIREKGVLNELIAAAYRDLNIDLTEPPKEKADGPKRKKEKGQGSEVGLARAQMCQRYYDVRTFGAVMSTGADAGQVRGPVQLSFARSIDRIVTLEHSITRMAVATHEDAEQQGGDNRTMGRKATVPYGLYRAHAFVSPVYAKRTGFSRADFELFLEACGQIFEHDRSAARGLMTMRAVVVFEHESPLGDASAASLFERLTVARRPEVAVPRSYGDYAVAFDGVALSGGPVHHFRVRREKAHEHAPGVHVLVEPVTA